MRAVMISIFFRRRSSCQAPNPLAHVSQKHASRVSTWDAMNECVCVFASLLVLIVSHMVSASNYECFSLKGFIGLLPIVFAAIFVFSFSLYQQQIVFDTKIRFPFLHYYTRLSFIQICPHNNKGSSWQIPLICWVFPNNRVASVEKKSK